MTRSRSKGNDIEQIKKYLPSMLTQGANLDLLTEALVTNVGDPDDLQANLKTLFKTKAIKEYTPNDTSKQNYINALRTVQTQFEDCRRNNTDKAFQSVLDLAVQNARTALFDNTKAEKSDLLQSTISLLSNSNTHTELSYGSDLTSSPGLSAKVLSRNNNKIYQLTDSSDQSVVLCISDISDEAKAARKKLEDAGYGAGIHLAMTYHETDIQLKGEQPKVCHVMPHSSQGSLTNEVFALAKTENTPEKMRAIARYANNIINIITDFNKCGVFFSDIKTGNFLLEGSKLIIADPKAFFPYEGKNPGKVELPKRAADGRHLEVTGYYMPPECRLEKPKDTYNVGQHESYTTGLSLYILATADDPSYTADGKVVPNIYSNKTASDAALPFNWKHPIFEGKDGEQLKNIIQGLVEPEPSKRMSIEKAKPLMQKLEASLKSASLAVSSTNTITSTSPTASPVPTPRGNWAGNFQEKVKNASDPVTQQQNKRMTKTEADLKKEDAKLMAAIYGGIKADSDSDEEKSDKKSFSFGKGGKK